MCATFFATLWCAMRHDAELEVFKFCMFAWIGQLPSIDLAGGINRLFLADCEPRKPVNASCTSNLPQLLNSNRYLPYLPQPLDPYQRKHDPRGFHEDRHKAPSFPPDTSAVVPHPNSSFAGGFGQILFIGPRARGKSPMLPMANALSPMTKLEPCGLKHVGDLQFSIVGGTSEWWDGSMWKWNLLRRDFI